MTNSSEKIEAVYVVDTHALLWYLTDGQNLSAHASAIFDAVERGEARVVISAIVVAEMFYADKKRKLFDDFEATYNELKARPNFRFAGFAPDEVLDFLKDDSVPEMHDRIVVGLARRLNAPLITHDAEIITAGLVKIAW